MPKSESTTAPQKRKRGRPFLAKSSNFKSTPVTSKAEPSSAIDVKLKSLPSSQKKLNFFALKESGKEDGAAIDDVKDGDDVLGVYILLLSPHILYLHRLYSYSNNCTLGKCRRSRKIKGQQHVDGSALKESQSGRPNIRGHYDRGRGQEV